MGKKAKKVGKNRQDKFYHLAKEQGYRSRAAFKLVQLNKRFNFLGSASRGVIDLCAAPGGWMQVARKYLPLNAPCLGVDLVPIRPVPGCIGIVGDITSDATRAAIRRELKAQPGLSSDEKVDVVLNDGSPNMGAAWLQDAYTQSELTLAGVKLATDHLAPGGSFVTKVFRSNDYNSLLYVMNQLFKRVNATKPTASRAESAEIYVFCTGYRAPKSIDPRILNPKFVFKEMSADLVARLKIANGDGAAEEAKPDLFLNTVMKNLKKAKRNRGGYEDGDLTLFKRISVLDFVRTPRPIALITETNQFSFKESYVSKDNMERDVRALQVLNSLEDTTPEVLSCCEDLKVLARREFKTLIKWRTAARDALTALKLLDESAVEGEDEDAANDADDESGDGDDDGIEDDSDIDEELNDARSQLLAKEKRKRRKAKKLKSSLQRKIDMKIILPQDDAPMDDQAGIGLFSMDTAKRLTKTGTKVLDVEPAEVPEAKTAEEEDNEEITKAVDRRGGYSLGDIDEAKKKNRKELEQELDMWYSVYAANAKKDSHGVEMVETKERKRQTKRRALREAAAARAREEGGDNSAGEEENARELELNSDASSSSDDDMAKDVDIGKNPISERDAALWFSQPMFSSAAVLSSDEDEDKNDEGDGNEEEADPEEDTHRAALQEAHEKAEIAAKKIEENGLNDGFEVVPSAKVTADSDSDEEEQKNGEESDSSFHSEDYDSDEKAEMVAIGKKMRTSKREATEILDDAYNRYTFDDPMGLPRWFADRDPEYRFRRAPVTKEQVIEMKEYIKSLQAAPSKKEQEFKARKKARIEKRMEVLKQKANTIAEQAEVSASSRMKAIEQLYKTAAKSSKSNKKSGNKQYQVARPGGVRADVGKSAGRKKGRKGAVRTSLVDRRLKSDKRGIKKANESARKAQKKRNARTGGKKRG